MALPVFPTLRNVTFPRPRAVLWSTLKQDAISGKRSRYPLWSYPVYQYSLDISLLRSDSINLEWQTLEGFINSVNGPAQLWSYLDPNDNAVVTQSFGQGDGVSTSFQLVRSLGGFAVPVFLVNGSPSIFVAGVLMTVTVDYTISPYGVVAFTSPPANGAALSWTGSYYFPCRFDDDQTSFSNFMQNFWELRALKFSTEKLP